MALLTDKKTSKILEDRLNEFSEYGMTLYYLLEEGRLDIKDLESIFFSKDDDKSTFIYGKILRQTKPTDLKKSFERYSAIYPELNELDDKSQKKDLNIIYTKKILDLVTAKSQNRIDKTYLNTYEHLLQIKNK
jgi:hypothetical protein